MSEFTPCPKPVPALPKPRAFNSTLPAPTELPNARNAERAQREWLRSYGSEDRALWFKALGCCICGRKPSENAHVRGGGGGRKADARFIVPMCRVHHRELHQEGPDTFSASYSVDLEATAEQFDTMWLARNAK